MIFPFPEVYMEHNCREVEAGMLGADWAHQRAAHIGDQAPGVHKARAFGMRRTEPAQVPNQTGLCKLSGFQTSAVEQRCQVSHKCNSKCPSSPIKKETDSIHLNSMLFNPMYTKCYH